MWISLRLVGTWSVGIRYLCGPCGWVLQGACCQSWGKVESRPQDCISPRSSECRESPTTETHLSLIKTAFFIWIYWSAYQCICQITWLRCSIEFDSLPVFSSRGMVFSSGILWKPFRGLWIRTRAVTSIFPFRPNLGDQTFSSMSASSVTVATAPESWHLLGAPPLLEGRDAQIISIKKSVDWC